MYLYLNTNTPSIICRVAAEKDLETTVPIEERPVVVDSSRRTRL